MTLRMISLIALMTACSGLEPQSGEYTLAGMSIVENSCNSEAEPDGLDGEEMDVVVSEDSASIEVEDELVFDCTLDKASLSCDPIDRTQNSSGDAAVTFSYVLSGEFIEDHVIDPLALSLEYTCEGADCEAFAADAEIDLPCAVRFEGTAATAPAE